MKVKVIEIFQDKITNALHYVGEEIDIADKTRVTDLVERKLVEAVETEPEEPKKTTAKRSK